MQYKIYEGVFDAFEKKIKRIINKCIKYGNPFVYEVLGEQFETIKEKNDFGEQFERTYKFVLVNVEGTAKIDNWEFIATLEHTSSGGNIIKNVWNDVSVPDRFKTSEPVCEHCNGKRMRRLLYIVRNTKTNEFKQIGSTCVKSYTRGLSAEQIACYLDGMTEFEEYNGFVPSNGKAYYRVEEVLTIAANVVDTIGYFNTSNDKLSTKDIAEETLSGFKESHAVREVNSRLCKAGKRTLMEDTDYAIYTNLPDEFTVYRGVGVGRNPKGLSWTRSYNKAVWFANRFNRDGKTGYVQGAVIKRDKVLAYFNTRNEDEIVANSKDLSNFKIIE